MPFSGGAIICVAEKEELPMAATQGPKPYMKLASTLVVLGMGLFSLEQFGLGKLEGPNHAVHLDSTLLSLMVIVPLALMVGGAVVFLYGKMRRL